MKKYQEFLLALVGQAVEAAGGGKIVLGAEVGVAFGATSQIILEAFPTATLLMVDWWQPAPEGSAYRATGDRRARLSAEQCADRMRAAADVAALYPLRAYLLKSPSVAAAGRIEDGSLDFVFIDGAHDRASVAADLAAWWPKVKRGGIFSGHDYKHHRYTGVAEAVDEFFNQRTEPFWLGPGEARAVWFTWKGSHDTASSRLSVQ